MGKMKVKLKVLRCKRCNHKWIPRKLEINICPKCKSALWNKNPKIHDYKKNKCSKCGSRYNLQMHHNDKNKINNNPKNLITLCNECHKEQHNKRINIAYCKKCNNKLLYYYKKGNVIHFWCDNCKKEELMKL